MDLIHANADRDELRKILDIEKYDCEISGKLDATLAENTWQLSLPDDVWEVIPVEEGHYLYIPNTEYGGPVKRVTHSTAEKLVTLSGPTWRGMLMQKIIQPPTGEAYLEINGAEANAALDTVIGSEVGDLFAVSTADSEITVSAAFRYTTMLTGIEKMLYDASATLALSYDQATKSVLVSAVAITDYSATVDLSQDYGVEMTSASGRIDGYNHVIALGAGELLDRDVVHRYRLADGAITSTAPDWAGTESDIVIVYDYGNAETVEDLTEGADKLLLAYTPEKSVEMDPGDAELSYKIGDIVGARDRLTGLQATATVIGQIVTMDANGIKIDTKVG